MLAGGGSVQDDGAQGPETLSRASHRSSRGVTPRTDIGSASVVQRVYGFKYRVGIACFYDEKPTHWQSRWRYWTAVWRREPHCSLMQVLEVDLVLGGQPRSTRTGTEAGHLPLALNVG